MRDQGMPWSFHDACTFPIEDGLPVILHADDEPAILLRLVMQRLGEGADLGVRQP